MATDLDRAYIINGDDLRIALSGAEGRPPLVPNPEDVARYILGYIAKPLDDSRFPISRADLVTRLGFALAEAKVTLTPHELAARLVADIETQTCPCRGPESECGCLQDEDAPASVAAPASALPGEDRETDLLTYACRALIALDDADAVQRIVDYLYERFLGGAR